MSRTLLPSVETLGVTARSRPQTDRKGRGNSIQNFSSQAFNLATASHSQQQQYIVAVADRIPTCFAHSVVYCFARLLRALSFSLLNDMLLAHLHQTRFFVLVCTP